MIVLDQFSRNMFRGTDEMFATDELALSLVLAGLEDGTDRKLIGHQRVFFYMPFMHSENPAMQDRCVELFTAFRDELSGEAAKRVGMNVDFANQHRDIVQRFGRFPTATTFLGGPVPARKSRFYKSRTRPF